MLPWRGDIYSEPWELKKKAEKEHSQLLVWKPWMKTSLMCLRNKKMTMCSQEEVSQGERWETGTEGQQGHVGEGLCDQGKKLGLTLSTVGKHERFKPRCLTWPKTALGAQTDSNKEERESVQSPSPQKTVPCPHEAILGTRVECVWI